MDLFQYRAGSLHAENVRVSDIARRHGTPCYVYSQGTVLHHYRVVQRSFAPVSPLICCSIKANASLAIVDLLRREGAGFDVVSGGELFRALQVGADPQKIVFAGVGKTPAEIEQALAAGILLFDVESEPELFAVDAAASRMGRRARVALRINPDVDAHTHASITTGRAENKFGIDRETARALFCRRDELRATDLVGVHLHIGSQITEVEPYVKALGVAQAFIDRCRAAGATVQWLNMGGGFGVNYRGDEAIPIDQFARRLVPLLASSGCRIVLEPGRILFGTAGILLTSVLYVKKTPTKTFVIVDAAMTDLVRPMLYDAFHHVAPVELPPGARDPRGAPDDPSLPQVDVVGGVCESTDVLSRARPLPPVKAGDVLAVFTAGAYGSTMSSNYNSRLLAPEVLVEGGDFRLTRQRQVYEDLIAKERY